MKNPELLVRSFGSTIGIYGGQHGIQSGYPVYAHARFLVA